MRSSPSRSGSGLAASALVLELTDKCTSEELRKRYFAEPSAPDAVVYDASRLNILALSREKYFALLTSQAKTQRDPEFLVSKRKQNLF